MNCNVFDHISHASVCINIRHLLVITVCVLQNIVEVLQKYSKCTRKVLQWHCRCTIETLYRHSQGTIKILENGTAEVLLNVNFYNSDTLHCYCKGTAIILLGIIYHRYQ